MVSENSSTSSVSDTIKRHSTALTTALFGVIALSGVMLFFHIAPNTVKHVHEWLGMIFIVAAAWHVARNWRGFVHMLGKKESGVVITLVALVAVIVVVIGPRGEGGNPAFRVAIRLEQVPVASVAPLFGQTADSIVGRLKAQGLTVSDANQSLAEVAEANNTSPHRLLGALLDK